MIPTPTQMITNWVEIKEKIPAINSDMDVWFKDKVSILIYGMSPLGDLTYKEWSFKVEKTLATIEEVSPNKDLSSADNQFSIIILICLVFANASSGLRPKEVDPVTESQEALVQEIIWRIIFILNRYQSQYILNILRDTEEKNTNEFIGDDKHDDVISSIFDILNNVTQALSEVYKKNYIPISSLVLKTFQIQEDFAISVEKDSKGWQQRKAANVRHEPTRKTRDFAVSLYEQGKWPSTRAASIGIINQVMDFGEENNRRFTSSYQAQTTIYNWLLDHDKNR